MSIDMSPAFIRRPSFNALRRVTHGGGQAVDLATEWLPDVVAMDISMPGLNGVEATPALRRDLRTENIIIIAFTALDEEEVLKR